MSTACPQAIHNRVNSISRNGRRGGKFGHLDANSIVMASRRSDSVTVQGAVGPGEESQDGNLNASYSLGSGVPVVIKSSGVNLVGVIEEIRPHALSILVRQALAEGTAVSIEFGAVSLESTIVTCQPHGGQYEICSVMPDRNERNRRTAERFPVTQEVRIWRAISDSPLNALVTDLSTHGLGLELSSPLENDETVMVENASNTAFGVARYCTSLCDGRFHVGLEVFHVMLKEGETE